jgi:hypothetical protein
MAASPIYLEDIDKVLPSEVPPIYEFTLQNIMSHVLANNDLQVANQKIRK